ncbi:hypothetical protein L218DRAFT_832699, partial [Marasmius fiardii PR-910]
LAADVVLEELKLLPELSSVVGRVRVKNLAYQKWVAARFTFDAWQTTSEVTAKYVESASGNVDIFTFVIKLTDMLARLEEKTMVVAIRYNINGREIWDNNGGKDYLVSFSRQSQLQNRILVEKKLNDGEYSRVPGGDISILRNRLEEVVQRQESELSVSLLKQARHVSHSRKPLPDFKNGDSLATRYDFGSSFNEPWVAPSATTSFSLNRHIRTNSHPSTFNETMQKQISRKSIPGSPRDCDDVTFRPSPYVPSDLEDGSSPLSSHQERLTRHHHRGYFDFDVLGDAP